jgi:hypothetical protein
MDPPTPAVIGNPCLNLDEPFNQPVYGTIDTFSPNIELSEHMQGVVSYDNHFQPGMVGLKSITAGLLPP